jgi:hypothetical protein
MLILPDFKVILMIKQFFPVYLTSFQNKKFFENLIANYRISFAVNIKGSKTMHKIMYRYKKTGLRKLKLNFICL